MAYDWSVPSEYAGRRRAMVSSGAPRASWDVPQSDYSQTHAAGSYGSTGDPRLDMLRASTLNDASARIRGAGVTARAQAPNDPSMAAYAQLAALLGGQSDAAAGLTRLGGQFAQQDDAQAWQEHMLRLDAEMKRKAIEEANKYAWLGTLGDIGGKAAGAYFGGLGG